MSQPLAATLEQAVFDAYPDAVLLVDADGAIVRANDAAATLLGYGADELCRMRIEALVPQAKRSRHAALRQGYQHAPARRPMGLQMELSAARRDGSEVLVEIALSPFQAEGRAFVLAAIRAIGEYPRVKQALRRARYAEHVAQLGRLAVDARDLGALVERTPALVGEALQCEAAVLYLLDAQRMQLRVIGGVGLTPEERVGQNLPLPPGSAAAAVLAEGASVHLGDADSLYAMPQDCVVAGFRSALVAPISDAGQSVGLLTVRSRRERHFGTDEKAAVEAMASMLATTLQRLKSQEALSHSQRIEAVGQLTGGIAHDFNNLLTVIQGNLQVLEDLPAVAGDAVAQDLVAAAARASRRGAELTAKLLAFSRRQMLQPRAIEPQRMLPPLAALLQRTLDARIRIEVDVQPGCAACLADPAQLESALLNLAINARDAMPDGGVLRLSAAACALPPLAVDAAAWAAGGVALGVSDTGVGMSEAVRARAFEPFFTTKDAGRGTGLGLATVHGFVHQSQGVVMLDSRVGEGTTVTLYLPSPPAAPAVASPARAAAVAPAVPRGLSVLLVEDEPEVLRVVNAFLEQWGCSVIACHDAQAALDAAGGARFDLLLSDVVLGPGLRGDELATNLRAEQPALPVLLMSGYAPDAGAARWPLLRKPFSRDQLAAAIVAALG